MNSETSLDRLEPGTCARVIRLDCEGSLRRRLYDMGVLPGAEIKVERVAPLGDPIVICVRGYKLSLRKQEASEILVSVTGEEGACSQRCRRRRRFMGRFWRAGA